MAFDNINKLENEHRRAQPRTLRKLAEALGVEPHELMQREQWDVAKKRGNNEGSISRRKDGRWEARYTVHTAEGPKRKVSVR